MTAFTAPIVSFEFFPPKTEALEQSLWHTVEALAAFRPHFVSVTYGAGGTTRARTHEIVTKLQSARHLNAAAHLTCVGAPRAEIDEIAESYWKAGIRHIVALRGDPSEGVGARYQPYSGGYAYAADLVEGLLKIAPFELSVGAYPEVHPEASSAEADLDNLKRKLDCGATRAISQFFFDNAAYFGFIERARKAGITAPIVPGILPITNFARAVEFAGKCGASIPAAYHQIFAGFDEKPLDERRQISETVAAEQCLALQAAGETQFHFYTLNRAELVQALCRHLGVKEEVVV